MDMIYDWLVVLHFIGLASLVGGFLVQMREKPRKVNAAMFHGVLTQLLTGSALVGLVGAQLVDRDIDYNKVIVKFIVVLVITFLVIKNRKKESVTNGIWGAIGGLSILNIVIAVLF